MSNDDRPTSPPLPQSWFSTLAAVGDDSLPDEPPAAPPPAKPAPAGLDWKAPSRMRVPVFERDGAPENTTPAAAAAMPRAPTANDETVRQLREHIVPDPMPLDDPDGQAMRDAAPTLPVAAQPAAARFGDDPAADMPPFREMDDPRLRNFVPPAGSTAVRDPEALGGFKYVVGLSQEELDSLELAALEKCNAEGARSGIALSVEDETALKLENAGGPPSVLAPAGTGNLVIDASFDPDFQEVRRESAPLITLTADFLEMDRHPPKGAEAAHAPGYAVPVDRDDATPNDGVVPPGPDEGSDDRFCCALWSNGTFSICPSDGVPLVLNVDDARMLVRYVSEVLSARARAAA